MKTLFTFFVIVLALSFCQIAKAQTINEECCRAVNIYQECLQPWQNCSLSVVNDVVRECSIAPPNPFIPWVFPAAIDIIANTCSQTDFQSNNSGRGALEQSIIEAQVAYDLALKEFEALIRRTRNLMSIPQKSKGVGKSKTDEKMENNQLQFQKR